MNFEDLKVYYMFSFGDMPFAEKVDSEICNGIQKVKVYIFLITDTNFRLNFHTQTFLYSYNLILHDLLCCILMYYIMLHLFLTAFHSNIFYLKMTKNDVFDFESK